MIRKALAASEADGSMRDFLGDLRSCGGRVVAELLESCLEELREEKGGGGGGGGGSGGEGRDQGRTGAIKTAARAAAAAAHERLHSGPWHAVPLAWRDAYTLACLLQVAAEEGRKEEGGGEGGGEEDEEEESMRLVDLALLLGGARFRRLAHGAADALLLASSPSSPSRSPPSPSPFPDSWPPPGSPVALPPGSMSAAAAGGERVEVLSRPPSLEEFLSRAVSSPSSSSPSWSSSSPPTPFVIPRSAPSFAASWPAVERWRSPRYWDAVAGKRTVPVEVGSSYLAEGWSQRLMTLRRFLEEHVFAVDGGGESGEKGEKEGKEAKGESKEKGYLAQHDLLEQVPALSRDVVVPDYALALCGAKDDGEEEKNDDDGNDDDDDEKNVDDDDNDDGNDDGGGIVACNLWLGPAATLSPPHTDPKRNLFCQVVGRKYVRLYGPECGGVLLGSGSSSSSSRKGDEKNEGKKETTTLTAALTSANTSSVDLFSPPGSDPRLSSLSFVDTVLGPGDVLFIPRGWWHFVLSLETSASVSFWF